VTDLEAVKLCAEAMGLHIAFGTDSGKLPFWCNVVWPDPNDNGGLFKYDPLHDKAQCFELVEKYPYECLQAMHNELGKWLSGSKQVAKSYDLARAIVYCVAKIQVGDKL
jgi:hypothetical protein